MKKNLLVLLAIVVAGMTEAAAQSTFKEGDLLVQLEQGVDVESFARQHQTIGLRMVELLTRRVNVWLCEYDIRLSHPPGALAAVRSSPGVINAQLNHYVFPRSVFPNDPRFTQQWALHNTGQTGGVPDADIDAPEAWEYSTGGLTVLGDQVVIAVIDGGADLAHEDLSFFKNVNDIPGNGIDDDNNGYIDDYHGWNAYNNNGNVPSNSHGTHVSGIAAARGNNNLGVSGVNWGAQVMPVAGSSGTEAIVVRAYGYVLEMRMKYNETQGAAGAFVVATNSSFGVDYGQPSNYPIWSAMYDSMGMAGILSCAATANLNINIDLVGDMPTACPSEWLVSVTNTTSSDLKNSGAAYGLTTIDLGAPGTSILSTTPNNQYGNSTGTSMATPTVAGAIGLLFSAAPAPLIQAYKEDPASIALLFKEWLLAGVDTIPALQNITVSGGRLNVHKAILKMLEYGDADDPNPPTNFKAFSDYSTPSSMLLTWTNPTTMFGGKPIEPFVVEVLRDSVLVAEVPGPDSSYVDTGLMTGTRYSYLIRAKIVATESLSTNVAAAWIAGGSPVPANPTNLTVSGSAASGYTIRWTNPSTQEDGTTLHDLAGVRLYRNGLLATTLQRTPADTTRVDSTLDAPPPGTHTYFVTVIDNDDPVNESSPSNTEYTPLSLPMQEPFSVAGTPSPALWIATNVVVNTRAVNPPSPPFALNLDGSPTGGGDVLESLPMDLSGQQGNGFVLAYHYQPRGAGESPEVSDSLIVELRNSAGEWRTGKRYPGLAAGVPTPPFQFDVIRLDSITPGSGTFFYDGFRFRVRNRATTGVGDDWFVDDLFFGIPNATPLMSVTPSLIADSIMANIVDTTSYRFLVANVNNLSSALEFTIVPDTTVPWLSVSPSSGTVPGGQQAEIGVHLNLIGVNSGVYEARLVVTSLDSTGQTETVVVRLNVLPAPSVAVSPDSFVFALAAGDSTSGNVVIRNTGPGALTYTSTIDGAFSGQQTDVAGNANSTTSTATSLVRGVVVGVTTPVLLSELRIYLGITVPRELRFVVYQNTSATGTFTKIYEKIIPNSGTGTQFYSSGSIGIELQAGMFYALATGWSGGVAYYWQTAAPVPIATSFGSVRGGFSQLAYPPQPTVNQNQLANIYNMEIITASSRWLTVVLGESGTIAPGDSASLMFRVSTAGVSGGPSTGALVLATNDPLALEVRVPFGLDVVTAISEYTGILPEAYSLSQNYPNPFNPETRLQFALPVESRVQVRVYNILGEEVATLVKEHLPAGHHVISWDGRSGSGTALGTGVYFARMEAVAVSGEERYTTIRKMLLMK